MCRSSGDQDGIAARRPRGASVAPRFTLIVADPDLAASRSIGREGDPQSITGKEGKLYVRVEAIHREGMWVPRAPGPGIRQMLTSLRFLLEREPSTIVVRFTYSPIRVRAESGRFPSTAARSPSGTREVMSCFTAAGTR